jgi:rhodanese-related sulfurtransferase
LVVKGFGEFVEEIRQNGIEELSLAHISALRKAGTPMTLIDIREAHERTSLVKVKGAKHIPRGLLELNIERAARVHSELIILLCSDGLRSVLAAESLGRMGYTNVKVLAGGFKSLKRAIKPKTSE